MVENIYKKYIRRPTTPFTEMSWSPRRRPPCALATPPGMILSNYDIIYAVNANGLKIQPGYVDGTVELFSA
jgi:hypothetical protein